MAQKTKKSKYGGYEPLNYIGFPRAPECWLGGQKKSRLLVREQKDTKSGEIVK